MDKKTIDITGKKQETQSINLLVEKSLAKTTAIAPITNEPKIANTQTIVIPIDQSLCKKQDKVCYLNGGVTKTAEVRLGGDNIIYSDIRLSEDNAITVKDNGLYVRPERWTVTADNNLAMAIDNDKQLLTAEVINSPKLNNKYEYELEVNSALDFVKGGQIDNVLKSKVDKEIGKDLSECDFTSSLKSKLENLNTSEYVKLLRYDCSNHKLLFNTDLSSSEVPFIGMLTGATYNSINGRLSFAVANGNPINIDLPKDNFVTSGVYDKINREIVLTLSNNAEVRIPAQDIIPVMKGDVGNAINVSVSSDNIISAELKISSIEGNALNINSDGIFAPSTNRVNLAIDQVDNTSDLNKPLSTLQKKYVDDTLAETKQIVETNYVKKENIGDIFIKSENGKIIFFVNGLAQMEISSEGVNFLV